MKNLLKAAFFILLSLLTEINVFSQYFIKSGKDSLGFEIDTAILCIDEIPGTIDWQVSKDTITWRSLNNSNDTLWVRIDSTAYYRAVTSEGTCYPVNSGAALVGFRSIQAAGNNITIDPAGGVYSSSNGIKIIVPPGATNENVTVSFELLDSLSAAAKLPLDVFVGKAFCIGLYCEPELIHFLKPVRIIVPASKYSYTDLPFIYLYNASAGLWNQYYGPMTCSEEEHYIEFTSQDLSPARIELIRNVHNSFGKKGIQVGPVCQRGTIGILNKSHDQIGSFTGSECQVASNYVEVEFKECEGKPVSKDYVHEISFKCVPEISAKIDKTCFKTANEEATITFKVSIGGLPLENVKIEVKLPVGFVIVKGGNIPTDDLGLLEVVIKSTVDNASGEITYKANPEYFLKVVEVSGPEGAEKHEEFPKTYPLSGKIVIECPVVFLWLNGPTNFLKDVGDTYSLKAACSGCDSINYFIFQEIGNTGVATVNSRTGEVKFNKPGLVYFYAQFADIKSNVIGFSVSYQGILLVSKKINWNNYNSGCCCPLDDRWNCWIMTYEGELHFKFWLDINVNKRAIGILAKGCEKVIYTITEPSNCRSETFNLLKRSGLRVTDVTTSEIIAGEQFNLDLDYDRWPSDEICNQIEGATPFHDPFGISLWGNLSSGVVDITRIMYIPEECVDRVYGSFQLD